MPKDDCRMENVCSPYSPVFGSATRAGLRLLGVLLVALLAPLGQPITAASELPIAAPRLSVDNPVASAGFFRLSWETDAGRVQLQEATDPAFQHATTPYVGPDQATVISGKPGGMWFYRVRALSEQRAGPWSEAIAVTVAHHDLLRAFLFLTVGVTVFAAIVLMIVRGPEKTQ
jgi:hypothetical protein